VSSSLITNVISQKEICELFEYNDGQLIWKIARSNVLEGDIAGSPNGKKGYLAVQIEGLLYRVHNLIWIMHFGDIPDGFLVDHKDNNCVNNRIGNLRLATLQQNNFNSAKRQGTSSLYKGVHWNKQSNSWRASIRIDGKAKYIGNFKDEYEAHLAWCKAAKEQHGEFFRDA